MAGVTRLTGTPNVREYTMQSASPAVAVGDLVKLNEGTLVIANAGYILGIMLDKDPSSTTTKVKVDTIVADDSTFGIKCGSTTAADSVGEEFAITFTTTALTAAEGSGDLILTDNDGRDAVGTSGGRLIVRFKPGSLQAHTPAAS
jgi:hypothetical protein